MDDLAREVDNEDDDNLTYVAIGLAHLVGVGLLFWICCRSCCRKATEANVAKAAAVAPEHLQPKKSLLTSYLLWLLCGPIANAHHFYLGRVVHGLVSLWTANFLCVGWVLDAVLLPYYVRSYNRRCAAPVAPFDSSRRRLLCRLPLLLLSVLVLLLALFVYLPAWLHYLHIVDIERLAAQTEANPYDVLGIAHTADLAEAKAAYRKASLQWHPDRNLGCGKPCELKMSEITKAFDHIKKRRAPLSSPDRTWESWLQNLGNDWTHVLSVWSQENAGAQAKTDL